MQQDERSQRALAYLRYQGAKPPAELRSLLERTAAECARSLEGVSEEQARFKPSPDEWSMTEVLRHLVFSAEQANRTARALASGAGGLPTYDPGFGPYQGWAFPDLKRRLAELLDEAMDLVEALPAAQETMATAPHILGDLNCREWLVFHRLHIADHLEQIEKIRSAPGYPEG
jgi:hypothetical protein